MRTVGTKCHPDCSNVPLFHHKPLCKVCPAEVTHLSIGVTIYPGGSSVRHPKGARSIGIGHPRSGDRCTVTRPYPLDPLRVAEQKSSFPVTRKGSRSNACAYCTSTLEVTKSKETHFCSGKDMKRHLETLRDNSSRRGCYICTVGANQKGARFLAVSLSHDRRGA